VSSDQPHILFACGGTGGHLFPALAIADELRKIKESTNILFVGTKKKIEARIVPERGYEFEAIWISGFHRSIKPDNLLFPVKVVVSIVQSFFLMKRFRPDVVVGTGGYVCGPVLYVASLLGIPTMVHESNSYPGITTRLLSKRATKVFTAFKATNRWLKRTDNIELVGTPTRESLDGATRESAQAFFGLDKSKKTVLVFGGSLGASSVNSALVNVLDKLLTQDVQLIWQTGRNDLKDVTERSKGKRIGWTGAFIDRMDLAYAAADVVVSRAGATTLAELTRIGKPAILVPYPYAAADHQTMNARTMADSGAAIMVSDNELDRQLESALLGLLRDQSRMEAMAGKSKSMGRPEAGKVIARQIISAVVS
jgi:UDP-N-acetylglucosamine--N-acetylmuramyl-(pentapeptide) pyrophosphoryl-undecaprenol N-acetylglucosamine transferase